MTFDIKNIKSPDFIKNLSIKELYQLCDDIRSFIIENVSNTGGHLSSNLGCVESIVALHYVFDCPNDKFIFDVGHQCYTHKILTGRAYLFDKLRKKDGVSGFPSYDESIYDVWEAGHSSTSLGAAAGFLESECFGSNVIAYVGDGSIQNGLSFEGINYIGSQKKQKVITILNDNEMSISRNVGRMEMSLNKKRVKTAHATLRKITPQFIYKHSLSLKNALRTLLYGDNFFSTLGYRYYGPIDGHDLKKLIKYYKYAKDSDSSVVIHLNTIKGKGYIYSENDSFGLWHGTGPFDIESGMQKTIKPSNIVPWGKAICDLLIDLMNENDKIKIINPAMIVGTYTTDIQKKYPNRIVDVGINEELAVLMAGAMSRNNIIPVVSIYSTFLQRAYDQVYHDVCRSNNHVVFLLDHAGIVSNDGSTHQGVFDIPMLLPMPNIVVATPSNINEAKQLLELSIHYNGPFVIRYSKYDTNLLISDNEEVKLGKWKIIKDIKEKNIICYGDYVIEFKEKLKDINVGLINAIFVKPIDLDMLYKLSNKKVIVVEEVMKQCSLYSTLLQVNNEYHLNIDIESHSINDLLVNCGSRKELREELGIDVDSIINKL